MKMNGNEVLFHPFTLRVHMMRSYISGGVKIFVRKVLPMKECIYNFFLHSAILFPSILRNKIVSVFFNFDLLYLFS